MNIDICKNCKNKLVFFQDLNDNIEDFYCYSDIKYLERWFENPFNVSLFYLKNKKWKSIAENKKSFETLKYIDDLLEKYDIDKIKKRCLCPYYLEHQLYDWNKKK